MLTIGALTDMSQTFDAATMWVAITAFGVGIGYLIHTSDCVHSHAHISALLGTATCHGA